VKISAFGAIFDNRGRILCVKRNYGEYTWTTPGGGIEHGESPLEAAQREAYEETGYRVEVEHLIGVYCSPWMDDYVLFFQFRVLGNDGWHPNSEIAEIGFFQQDTLPQPMKTRTAARIHDAFDRVQGTLRVFGPEYF
jgi:8-oxo-dGTP diphosphatase